MGDWGTSLCDTRHLDTQMALAPQDNLAWIGLQERRKANIGFEVSCNSSVSLRNTRTYSENGCEQCRAEPEQEGRERGLSGTWLSFAILLYTKKIFPELLGSGLLYQSLMALLDCFM